MSNVTFKLFPAKLGGTQANTFIGKRGEVFYDTDGLTPIRLSDGVTPGGIPFSIVSIRQSFNPQFTDAGGLLAGVTQTGSYVKQGLIVHFRIFVDFANQTNLGTTQYQFTLPFPLVGTTTIRGGTLHQVTGDSKYHIAGITDIADSTTIMKLYYTGSTTDLAWKYNTPVGATTSTTHFDLSGAYETTS